MPRIKGELTKLPSTCGSGAQRVSALEHLLFDERGRTLVWVTRTVYRLYVAQAQKVLHKEGITISHWYYLRVLAERGVVNQLELSKLVGMASASAVPALDTMEKLGLVTRSRDGNDRRKYLVMLTEKGTRLVARLLPEMTAMIADSLADVSIKDLQACWKVLRKVEDTLVADTGNAQLD